MIEKSTSPEYKPLPKDDLRERAIFVRQAHPHLLTESLGWHSQYLQAGQMLPRVGSQFLNESELVLGPMMS